MRNEIPKSATKLVSQIGLATVGVTKYAATLKLAAHPVADLTSEKDALELAYNNNKQAQDDLKTKIAAQRSIFKTCRTFSTLIRELLKPTLGFGYSEAWNIVGFTGKLRIPSTISGMLSLLTGIERYLTENPQFANTEANLNAVRAEALYDQLLAAKAAVDEARSNRRTTKTVRTLKEVVVQKRLRGLRDTLVLELPSTDGRFLEFGFNIPDSVSTPDVPLNLIAVLIGPLSAALKWDKAARAERYRIYKKVVGVDSEMVLAGTRDDLDFVLEGLPAGKTIQIAVAAVNSAGESQLSQVVSIVTP